MKEFKTEQCTANRGFTTGPTKVLSRRMRAGLILFRVNRRTLSVVLILVLCIPAAAFFIAVPQWQIEHPGDIRRLVGATERVDGVREVRSYLHLPDEPPPNKADVYEDARSSVHAPGIVLGLFAVPISCA